MNLIHLTQSREQWHELAKTEIFLFYKYEDFLGKVGTDYFLIPKIIVT
jgi:hypothetical protein